ncbi:MAG: ATP-binding cassette domain-containing protein [Candidatus Pacebacteria bacterium]|nr:ATP-binding cassette domain-containing protein [Candidatus Paceibacterota bacterium]
MSHIKPIIKVRHLTKKFKGLTAVDDISFEIKKGEIAAFLGPNGAGKTTTIRMLTTLLGPTEGEILINGFNPLSQQDQVRKSFGIVFQDSSLDEELTALENMEFHGILYKIPKEMRKKRVKNLLEIVDLWERRNSLVKTFSGGMRRRLEIARGLLHHPKIFFLDEPTLGLDTQTRNKIWEHIHQLNQKYQTTIFFTTHYLEEAEKMANRIAIIDKGKIVALGTVDRLKRETKTESLEAAYLAITGKDIREENAGSLEKMRMRMNRMRKR